MHYYNGLLLECERRDLRLRLVINQADVALVLDAAARGAREELAAHLSSRMRELESAGAAILAIAAVTPHMCMPELVHRFHAPIVDIVEVLNAELRRRGIDRVALLGTRAVTASHLFGRLDATVIDASGIQVAHGHQLYVSIVRDGYVRDETAQALAKLATQLIYDSDVQAVVLAGTELALVPSNAWSGLQTVDCAKLHIEALVAAAAL